MSQLLQQPMPSPFTPQQPVQTTAPTGSGIPLAVHQYAQNMIAQRSTPQTPARLIAPPRTHSQSTLGMSPYNSRGYGGPNTPASPAGINIGRPSLDNSILASIHSPLSHRQQTSVECSWSVGAPHSLLGPASALQANALIAAPEADALLFSILLSDTQLGNSHSPSQGIIDIVDLWHDANFDACPVCVCTNSIRGVESGQYVPTTSAAGLSTHTPLSPTGLQSAGHVGSKCSCGFSAVRYRQVSQYSSAYAEDECEVVPEAGIWETMRKRPAAPVDLLLAELIRQQATHRDVPCQVISETYLERQCSEATMVRGKLDAMPRGSGDYKVSRVDIHDLKILFNMALECACRAMDSTMPTQQQKTTINFWAYSRAARELVSVADRARFPTHTAA
jgi:hypothetical protein